MIKKLKDFFENPILDFFNKWPKLILALSGILSAFCFAPHFRWYLLFFISFLPYFIQKAKNYKESFKYGWIFGTTFFFINLNWIVIGVTVYLTDFWWALPIVYFLFPSFLGIYIGVMSMLVYSLKNNKLYIIIFASLWVIFELIRSKLLTGFAWNLMAYSFSFSTELIQITSLIGPYGLSLIVIYIFAVFYYLLQKQYSNFIFNSLISVILVLSLNFYGKNRLNEFNSETTNISIRVVQPSIKQTDKWTVEKFWENYETLKSLSNNKDDQMKNFAPDIILWPEAAIVAFPTIKDVLYSLRLIVTSKNTTLVTGGVTKKISKSTGREKIFSSMYALKEKGDLIFDYHKSHLVPFGEYMPYNNIIPLKKLTPGIIDYTPGGIGFIAELPELNLKIRPLICYEITFPTEVRMLNSDADVIFNITNDAWYGESGGPYQHFYTTIMRAVENGIPIIRSANNGISAIIDPVGRVIVKTKLNEKVSIDYNIPKKLTNPTIYSKHGESILLLFIWICGIFCLFLQKNKDKK